MKRTLTDNPIYQATQQMTIAGKGKVVVQTMAEIAIEVDIVERADKTSFTIGRTNPGTFDVEFPAGQTDTFRIFREWWDEARNKGANTPGGSPIGVSPEYKRTVVRDAFRHFQRSGDQNLTYELLGCFPSSMTLPEHALDSTDEAMITVTISYDEVNILN